MIRVDFYDKKDLESRIYGTLAGFSAPHVGLKVGDQYLVVPDGRPSGFYPSHMVERMIGRCRTHSFDIHVDDFDTACLVLLGTGHVIGSRTARIWDEFAAHYGLWSPIPEPVSCRLVVTTILRYLGLPIEARTSKELYEELRTASRFGGSRVVVEEVLSTDP